MSEEKQFENDPERTLITLEQLSQTIEVMTSVVNRLRQHLSEQLHAQMEAQQAAAASEQVENSDDATDGTGKQQQAAEQSTEISQSRERKESFVVEIRQQEGDDAGTDGKILH